MHPKCWLSYVLVIISVVLAEPLRAQDNPVDDPDLKEMLKQAQEMQKQAAELQKNRTSLDARKKLAEMEAQAKAETARQEQEEKHEKGKMQAALKKQLDAPGPIVLPNWTPATPQFKANGAPTRKIVDDEVRIVQTGSSSLTPKELADSWEAAAVAAKNLNHVRNNIDVNGKLTTVMFLSTRSDPVEKVELEASREPSGKITQVEISSPLPKPDFGSE
jgi:DNA-binding TFAR19-related protein (PDSD5 family)